MNMLHLLIVDMPLTLLHSERPKLSGVLAVQSATGLNDIYSFQNFRPVSLELSCQGHTEPVKR